MKCRRQILIQLAVIFHKSETDVQPITLQSDNQTSGISYHIFWHTSQIFQIKIYRQKDYFRGLKIPFEMQQKDSDTEC